MKLSHLTIFFLIIVLPFSISLRNNMNNYFIKDMLIKTKDYAKINE